MNKASQIISLIQTQRMLPLYFHHDENTSLTVLKTLYDAGIRAVEYTNRGTEALNNFKKLIAARNATMHDMKLGAGTVKNMADANAFIDAGADFIICPCVIPEVGKVVQNAGLLWIPGCMTTTEIALAEQNGAVFVKIFPGNLLGPPYITAVKEIFPHLLFMPTGGVEINKENIAAWFNAGVAAVGFGSRLISKSSLENKDYKTISELAKQALNIIQSIK